MLAINSDIKIVIEKNTNACFVVAAAAAEKRFVIPLTSIYIGGAFQTMDNLQHIYIVEMWWSGGQLQYSSVGLLCQGFDHLTLHQEHTDYMNNIQILKYALTVDISWHNKIV